MSDCPRLATELAHLDPRADPDEIARRVTDHQRWHVDCIDHDPGCLPREPEETR